ncbi:MAG: hypothetical protein ACTHNY_01550 [Solirubrobacterales bacterium]
MGKDTAVATEIVELFIEGDPILKAELRSLALEVVSPPGSVGAQEATEELRELCQTHAGLDINANDMLTPLARELLIRAFSSVDWPSLAEKIVSDCGERLGGAAGVSLDLRKRD